MWNIFGCIRICWIWNSLSFVWIIAINSNKSNPRSTLICGLQCFTKALIVHFWTNTWWFKTFFIETKGKFVYTSYNTIGCIKFSLLNFKWSLYSVKKHFQGNLQLKSAQNSLKVALLYTEQKYFSRNDKGKCCLDPEACPDTSHKTGNISLT